MSSLKAWYKAINAETLVVMRKMKLTSGETVYLPVLYTSDVTGY